MRIKAAFIFALAASPALAHPGHDIVPATTAQAEHLLTSPDHVLFFVGAAFAVAAVVVMALRQRGGRDV